MSRAIRFRLWDKINKRMVVPEYCGNLEGSFETESEYSIISQSTGLFDKNGVEIFEGDILKYYRSFEWDEENYRTCQVMYGKGCFDGGFYSFMGFYLQSGAGQVEPCELTSLVNDDENYIFKVVGHIYE